MSHQLTPEMQQCIERCITCYRICLRDAMNHCLESGGKHVQPRHFRLMINCADICNTCANVMLSSSDIHRSVCAACAEVCEACAQSCQALGDMDECVRVCEQCAESCRSMSST